MNMNCCSLTRGPPHSTPLLALADVQRIDQNLGGTCQNLAKILASSARILPAKCNCVFQFQCQEIQKKTCTNGSRSNKIHQNGPKCSPIEKISPQEPKRSQKGSIKKNFWEPPGHQKSAKIENKGCRKSMIFSTPSWNRLCLILGSPRHPKSSQNETKIDPRPAQTHFRPDCIFCRPCQ